MQVGGHYTRVVTDMSNWWDKGAGSNQPGSVLKNFDVAMSIPVDRSTTYSHVLSVLVKLLFNAPSMPPIS